MTRVAVVSSDSISFSGFLSELLPELSGQNIGQKICTRAVSNPITHVRGASSTLSGVLAPNLLPLQVNVRAPNLLPQLHVASCASQAHFKLVIFVCPASPCPFRSISVSQLGPKRFKASCMCARLFHFTLSKPGILVQSWRMVRSQESSA